MNPSRLEGFGINLCFANPAVAGGGSPRPTAPSGRLGAVPPGGPPSSPWGTGGMGAWGLLLPNSQRGLQQEPPGSWGAPAWLPRGTTRQDFRAAAAPYTHRDASLTLSKNIHFRVIKIYKYLNRNLPIVAAVSHVISDTSVIMNVSHLAEVPVSI